MTKNRFFATATGRKMFLLFILFSYASAISAQDAQKYFVIQVVDESTGRGVPLIELETTNSIRYYTDSKGILAFYEPGLMNKRVYFLVSGHGYEFRKDGFGSRGIALNTVPGTTATIKVKRTNIAERIYRVTGEGIYDESVKAGLPVPLKQPISNAKVMGQDSYVEVFYKGKIYWFFGDTGQEAYFLGNYGASGAMSALPERGGLDPNIGVDLTYFTDSSGFSRPMFKTGLPGAVWISWAVNLKDGKGNEHLYAHYARVKGLGSVYEMGMALFNDSTQTFERILPNDAWLDDGYPVSNPVRVTVDNKEYIYFTGSFRMRRVPADIQHITDLKSYESFTCLKPHTALADTIPVAERSPDGKLVYGWKADTKETTAATERQLFSSGQIKEGETWWTTYDITTGKPIVAAPGTIYWNNYVRRWIMIAYGNIGEVFYFEGDTPTGPWVYGRKIISHDRYTFYNIGHHPMFDQENGKIIYLEGTYTNFFSGNPINTPKYDYNQIMYRLDLGDERLVLPQPVYHVKNGQGKHFYMMRDAVDSLHLWDAVSDIPFFAVPPGRHADSLVPVYATQTKKGMILSTTQAKRDDKILCYALPSGSNGTETINKAIVHLTVAADANGRMIYTATGTGNDIITDPSSICRVWRNPSSLLLLDHKAKPVAVK